MKSKINDYNKNIQKQNFKKYNSFKIDDQEDKDISKNNNSLILKKDNKQILRNVVVNNYKDKKNESKSPSRIKKYEQINGNYDRDIEIKDENNKEELNNYYIQDTDNDYVNDEINFICEEKMNEINKLDLQENQISDEFSENNRESNNDSNINPININNSENDKMFENLEKEINNSNAKNKKINLISKSKILNYTTNYYKKSDITQISNENKLNNIKKEEEQKFEDKKKEGIILNQNSNKSNSNKIFYNKRKNSADVKIGKNIFNINKKSFNSLIKKEKFNKSINNIIKVKEKKPVILNISQKEIKNIFTSPMPLFYNIQNKRNDLTKIGRDSNSKKNNNKNLLMTSDKILKEKKLDEKFFNEKSKKSIYSSQNSIFNKSKHSTDNIYEYISRENSNNKINLIKITK